MEIVFGLWAIVLIVAIVLLAGRAEALGYAETRDYTEPLFVVVVMVIAASRPILQTVRSVIDAL